ncbi:hypothetical protein [Kordia sp.]|uniref:hypothetical protein n=1 Tax=Kordia sp. TaxID=1965332 RepID=UPI003D2D9C7E
MKYINYNKWAFHFMIWVMIICVLQVYLTVDFNTFTYNQIRFLEVMQYFEIIAFVLFLTIVLFLTLSITFKKEKNYQFWLALIGAIGYVVRFIFSILFILNTTYEA